MKGTGLNTVIKDKLTVKYKHSIRACTRVCIKKAQQPGKESSNMKVHRLMSDA